MGTPFDLAQTDHLLTTTRAVRKRLDLTRPVPRETIVDCIRIATQAPAGGNIQRWRWLVVDDASKKLALSELYRKAYTPYMAEQRKLVADFGNGNPGLEAIMQSSDHLADVLQDVPAFVIPCLLARPTPEMSGQELSGLYGSVLPAVWSFMLAARSRGLGTAWTTLHLGYEAEAAALLGIPGTVSQLALIPVAYYTGDDFKPGTRRPAEEVTYFNAWKSPA